MPRRAPPRFTRFLFRGYFNVNSSRELILHKEYITKIDIFIVANSQRIVGSALKAATSQSSSAPFKQL